MVVKCEICGEDNVSLLQEHHWSYNPEKKSILCIKCHQIQHKTHGIGRGKINQRDILFLRYAIKYNRDNLSTKDFDKFYKFLNVYGMMKKLRDLGLIKRKGYSEHPSFYVLNIDLVKKVIS